MSFKIGKEANEKELKAALEGIVANCLAKANGKKIREARYLASFLERFSLFKYPSIHLLVLIDFRSNNYKFL
jgi:hypothetical protein